MLKSKKCGYLPQNINRVECFKIPLCNTNCFNALNKQNPNLYKWILKQKRREQKLRRAELKKRPIKFNKNDEPQLLPRALYVLDYVDKKDQERFEDIISNQYYKRVSKKYKYILDQHKKHHLLDIKKNCERKDVYEKHHVNIWKSDESNLTNYLQQVMEHNNSSNKIYGINYYWNPSELDLNAPDLGNVLNLLILVSEGYQLSLNEIQYIMEFLKTIATLDLAEFENFLKQLIITTGFSPDVLNYLMHLIEQSGDLNENMLKFLEMLKSFKEAFRGIEPYSRQMKYLDKDYLELDQESSDTNKYLLYGPMPPKPIAVFRTSEGEVAISNLKRSQMLCKQLFGETPGAKKKFLRLGRHLEGYYEPWDCKNLEHLKEISKFSKNPRFHLNDNYGISFFDGLSISLI